MLNEETILLNNQTKVDYENNLCIHVKLEEQALVHHNATAIIFKDQNLSYLELNNQSNSLANKLIELGVNIEDFVVVCLDRSLELMISIYGVLKSGGVYLPVSPSYPEERKKYILEDAAPKLIITTRSLSKGFGSTVPFLFIEELQYYQHLNYNNPCINLNSSNLAYVIYTSGSTGKPKGVLIEHHSVMNRIGWMQKIYPISSRDVLLQKTPITFDVSIWELFWWSFVGAKLVLLPPGDEKSPEKLTNCIVKENVSIIHFVPSMFNTYIKYLSDSYPQNYTATLRWIFCSGEELHQNTVLDFYVINERLNNSSTVVNLYGPTEATVDVTYYTCPPDPGKLIPIGRPIDNTRIYIIDENNELVPSNVPGELVICGVNLARGYLKLDELTSQKFISLNVMGEIIRAYKTGDLAYYNDQCEIIYQGRIDRQIKLRGFRIELGEIENTLLSISDIVECGCIVKDEKQENAHIVCFFVSKENNLRIDGLRDFLKERLPEYMIPAVFLQIDSLPLSSSGKLDRDELLKIMENNTKQTPVKTVSDYERKLQGIWSLLFNKPMVNPEMNFFDLGGNSLMIVQLSFLIKKEFKIDFDILMIMQYPTIRSLAKYFSDNKI